MSEINREIQVKPVELSTETNIALLQQLTKTLATVRGGTEHASNQAIYEETEKRILGAICMLLTFRVETIATLGSAKAPVSMCGELRVGG